MLKVKLKNLFNMVNAYCSMECIQYVHRLKAQGYFSLKSGPTIIILPKVIAEVNLKEPSDFIKKNECINSGTQYKDMP